MPNPDRARLPRVLTRAGALRLGIGTEAVRYRVASGRWRRLAPQIYLTCTAPSPPDLCLAAGLHGGRQAVVSGHAALFQYGLVTREPCEELVLVPLRSGVGSWGRIRVRATPIAPTRSAALLPLASVARAVSDHVHELGRQADATALVTTAIQRRLCTLADLDLELRRSARRGSRMLRVALEDAGHGAHSEPEARAGRLLRQAAIVDYQANGRIELQDRVFYGDFVWPHLRAVLEVDSIEHHFSPADQTATLARDHLLQLGGWTVMHVTPSQLRDGPVFVTLVQDWIAMLAARPTRS